jgi:lariat debranching enzyme
VQGCCHGELDAIYDRLKLHEEQSGHKVDLLLCCGDFQSLRNTADYHSFAVPPKYHALGSFFRYYSGEKEAPVTTLFVGGNHEASQPLQELYYGGWVAPKIYYLGAAGVVNVAGVRIGGISGIYKSYDYTQGRFERPPYDRSTMRSVYHVRNTDVYRLKCLSPENRLDIMLSHDWPQGIEQHGDTDSLLRQKPFFREEVQRNELGSPPNRELLDTLKPEWWFSAHLHVKFKAQVQHAQTLEARDGGATILLVPSQVQPASEKHESAQQATSSTGDGKETTVQDPTQDSSVTTDFQSLESSKVCGVPDLTDLMTQFLSLDKCLPRRQHLSILHVPCNGRKDVLEYDPEWLAILKKTHPITSAEKRRVNCPRDLEPVTYDEIDFVRTRLVERRQDDAEPGNDFAIPHNFTVTASPQTTPFSMAPLPMMGNPQTDELLNLLGLEHVITVPFNNTPPSVQLPGSIPLEQDDNEIDLEDDAENASMSGSVPLKQDDNAIDLEEDEENIGVEDECTNDNGIILDYEGDKSTDFTPQASTSDPIQASKKPRTNS